MKKIDIPFAPMTLCLIIGANLESLVRNSLDMSGGKLGVFIRGPVSIGLLLAIILLLGLSLSQRKKISRLGADSD